MRATKTGLLAICLLLAADQQAQRQYYEQMLDQLSQRKMTLPEEMLPKWNRKLDKDIRFEIR